MKASLCLLAITISVTGFAIDWSGYRKAKALEKEKRYAEAIAVYEKLSDAAKSDKDDQQYMEWAVSAARRKKDAAAEKRLIARIKNPDRRKYVQMLCMKPAEIIAAYQTTDFMKWPVDLRSNAYAKRGTAYNRLRQFDKALVDFDKSLSLPGGHPIDKIASGWYAGMIYARKKDQKKAEEYYRKALAVSKADYGVRSEALTALSVMLIKQKRGADACKLFEPVARLQKMKGYWGIRLNNAYADALIAAGKKVEALKTLDYVKKIATGKAKAAAQKRIDALSADML